MAKTQVYFVGAGNISTIVEQKFGENVSIAKTNSGAPYLKNDDHFISISHRGKQVVLAVSEDRVGVDIEKTEQKPAVFKIARRYFGESVEVGDYLAFYRSWTKKEALGKLRAEGLSKQLLALDNSPDSICEEAGTVYFSYIVRGEYIVTVADMFNDVEFIYYSKPKKNQNSDPDTDSDSDV